MYLQHNFTTFINLKEMLPKVAIKKYRKLETAKPSQISDSKKNPAQEFTRKTVNFKKTLNPLWISAFLIHRKIDYMGLKINYSDNFVIQKL